MLRLLWNPLTGALATFIAVYFTAVYTGFGEWIDPLISLGLGWLLFRYVAKWIAVVPWGVFVLQTCMILQIHPVGAWTSAGLIAIGMMLLLDVKPLAAFRQARFGDIHMHPLDIEDMAISGGIGDVTIDLTQAISLGGERHLVIERCIGSVTVYIPYDVAVSVNGRTMVGTIEAVGQRCKGWKSRLSAESDGYEKSDSKLRINLSSWVGDLVVRSI